MFIICRMSLYRLSYLAIYVDSTRLQDIYINRLKESSDFCHVMKKMFNNSIKSYLRIESQSEIDTGWFCHLLDTYL